MKITHLTLENYGGFEDINFPLEPDVTVIAGVNGVGKSTILRTIATLLSKTHRRTGQSLARPIKISKDVVFVGAQKSEAQLFLAIGNRHFTAGWKGDLGKRAFEEFDFFGPPDEDAEFQIALAVLYTSKRQLPGMPRSLPESRPFERSHAYAQALHEREVDLRDFMHWFRTQERLGAGDRPQCLRVLESLRQAVTGLMPDFSNLRIEESPRLAFMVDKCGKPFALHQLSDGERGLLALVFDLTRRLAIANPDLDDPIKDGIALVLIDEIELHLHPKWQRDVLRRLCDTFRACQFVVTTHSPLVLGEVQARSVRFLEYDEQGKVVCTIPDESFGMDANRILDELMDAPVRNRGVQAKLRELFVLIDEERFDEAKRSFADLQTRLGEHDPELTRADTLMHFLEGE